PCHNSVNKIPCRRGNRERKGCNPCPLSGLLHRVGRGVVIDPQMAGAGTEQVSIEGGRALFCRPACGRRVPRTIRPLHSSPCIKNRRGRERAGTTATFRPPAV